MNTLSRSFRNVGLAVLCLLAIVGIFSACASDPTAAAKTQASTSQLQTNTSSGSFTFDMVPSSAAVKAKLPKADADVTITPGSLNDVMTVKAHNLVPDTDYDLFVIQLPGKPFGVAWYQSDLHTDSHGNGSVTVRGIFDVETFSVSQGGTTTFSPTKQWHLGLWFNDPEVPFKLGMEPGQTSPIVTPFNGEQNAGIQVLNTSNFPDNAGPLSHVHR